ncbi:hypothetical protein DXV76_12760 [Rhodobacteraceae bacterium CCMM004]|nr:hypothetical protein DXV76_12760 [Rhodobacteraceae bacterium CCMM004]
MFRPLTAALSRFGRREHGGMSIESVLVLPMLAWALLACFSYFDGLRQANVGIKATHTIGDLLSRETAPVDAAYMDGMDDVLNFLVRSPNPARMRVTTVTYDGGDEAFELGWSHGTGGAAAFTDADLPLLLPHLPQSAGGDTLIVVETWVDYPAPFVMGLSSRVLTNVIVTRPRFAPQLKWADGGSAALTG